MISRPQFLALIATSIVMWVVATLYIRLFPSFLINPLHGAISFLTTLAVGWASVRVIRQIARLEPDQLLIGVSIVGTVAMMIDGIALHWAPSLYGTDERMLRLGAAWLLWGYGVSLGIALMMSSRAAGRNRSMV